MNFNTRIASARQLVLLLMAAAWGLALSAPSFAQTAPWVQARRTGDEMRFLFPGKVERYHLGTRSWMSTVNLPKTGATAFTGDNAGAFVAYGSAIFRYGPDFTGESPLGASPASAVNSLFLDGQLLLAVHSSGAEGRVTLFNRDSGVRTGGRSRTSNGISGCALAPGRNRLFGRTRGVSPGDIAMMGYSDTGVPLEIEDSAYHSTFPEAEQVFIFPDESLALDSAGTVYTTEDLRFHASLASRVTAVDWSGNSFVILGGAELIAYNSGLRETGRGPAPSGAAALAVAAGQAFVFAPGADRPEVTVVPLNDLKPPVPGPAVDPSGLGFSPDAAFMDNAGNLTLLSREHASLFRWSVTRRAWQPTIPLVGAPDAIAFSPGENVIYTAYPNQVLRRIDLTRPEPAEDPLIALPEPAMGLAAAGDLLYVSGRRSARIFKPDGTLTWSRVLDSQNSRHNTWDPVRRRMYHFRDDWSPNELLYDVIGTDGAVSFSTESPYHGEYAFNPPLRVSPDGNLVITGDGPVFNANDLTFKTKLPAAITDVLWKGEAGTAFTLRSVNNSTSLAQSWSEDFTTPGAVDLKMDGWPFRLFSVPEGLVAVTLVNGAPRFTVFDTSLNVIHISPSAPWAADRLAPGARTVSSVGVSWTDRSDNEDGFRVEYRAAGSDGAWITGASTSSGATAATVSGLPSGTAFEFRVVAFDGALETPSMVLRSATLGSPDEPVGEPYGLTVTRVYQTSVSLSWKDNADNETGFRVYRSTEPGGEEATLRAPANATTFTDSGLRADTTYYYRVQAVNGELRGDLSAPVSVKTLTANTVPAAPFNLAAIDISATEFTLTWRQVSLNEDEFIIEVRPLSGGAYTEAGRVPFDTTAFRLTGLTPGQTVTVRVRASNAQGAASSSSINVMPRKLGGDYLNLTMRGGNVQYFAFKSPNRMERYDLANRVWLPPVPVEAEISAFWVDASGIFAAEGASVIRWNLDGGGRSVLFTAPSSVSSLFTTGDILGLSRRDNPDSRITTLNKRTGAALASIPFTGPVFTASVDPVSGRVFLRGDGPVTFVDVSAAGTRVRTGSALDDGSTGGIFVFPSGGRVASVSGAVFASLDLASIDRLGGFLTYIAFRGADVPVVLRGNKLQAYTGTLKETGSVTLDSSFAKAVSVEAADAVVFLADGASANGMSLRIVPLSQLNAPEPGPPDVNGGLAFTADEVFLDQNSVIQVYSKPLQRLMPWSPVQRAYQTPVLLAGSPGLLSYNSGNGTLLTKYGGGDIRRTAFPVAAPVETSLVNVTGTVVGLVAAGELTYAATTDRVKIYSPAGALLADRTGKTSRTNVWDPVRRRVYHYWDEVSPGKLIYETIGVDGRITASEETDLQNGGQTGPIRVSPDGDLIFTGSGGFYKADDLSLAATLPFNTTADAAWRGRTLFTIRGQDNRTWLQSWSGPAFTPGPVARDFPGTPLRVLDTPRGLVVMTFLDNAPHFILLDENENPVYDSPYHPQAPGALAVSGRGPESVFLTWTDLSDNEEGFVMEYRVADSAVWTFGGNRPPGSNSGTVGNLNSGTTLEFRVRAWDENLFSPSPPAVTATTLTDADQPVGEPYNLRVTRLFHDSVTISWTDNASNETGFRVLRSTTPDGAAVVLETAANTTSFTDSGRSPGTICHYRIQAVNGAAAGDLSAQITVRIPAVPFRPAEPQNPQITGVTDTTASLSWLDRSLDEESFVVEYAEDGENHLFREGGRAPFNSTGLTVTGLAPDTAYVFRVRAVNSAGGSESYWVQTRTLKTGGEFLGKALRAGAVYYFAFSGPDRIERFDLQVRTWLPALEVEEAVTSLWADGDGVYAGGESRLIRWNADGTGRRQLLAVERPVGLMATLGDILVFESEPNYRHWTTLNKQTGSVLSTFTFYPQGSSLVSDLKSGRLIQSSREWPAWMEIAPDGTLRGSGGTPHDFQAPYGGERGILFPDGGRFVELNGAVYSSGSMRPSNGLGGELTDVAFLGKDVPVVLRGEKLVSHTSALLPFSELSLGDASGKRVAVEGTDILVFMADVTSARGFTVKTVPLSALNPPAPGQNLNPEGLPYAVDEAFLDKSGLLRLYSRSQQGLFTWSPVTRSYTSVLPLASVPERMVYSPASDRLYFSYRTPFIHQLKLSDPAAGETRFATAPDNVSGIQLAETRLLASQNQGCTLFSGDGSVAFQSVGNYFPGADLTWDPVKHRMYHFTDGLVPRSLLYDTITPDGAFFQERLPGYGGGSSVSPPIRVSPDGSRIVIGSGIVFEASDLNQQTQLDAPVTDVVWLAGEMITLEPGVGGNSLARRHTSALNRGESRVLGGTPARLFVLPENRLLAITSAAAGIPRFHILDDALNVIFDSGTPAELRASAAAAPAWNSQTSLWEQTVTVRNNSQNEISGFRLELSGLPPGVVLYNASGGTGAGYIRYDRPLSAGREISLALQYGAAPNADFSPVLHASSALPGGNPLTQQETIRIDRAEMSVPGVFILGFTVVPGGLYVVQYLDHGGVWTDSTPALRAAGTQLQWIDSGAPRTVSPPGTGGPSRFYRVKQVLISP